MLGMLFGSFGIGMFSDRYGRMNALMLSIALVSCSGFLGAFMNDMHGFGFFRFLTGIGGIGCFMVTFVICVEYVGSKYTMLTGIAIEIPFALGEFVLGFEAYFIRDWFTLQIVAYAPLALLFGLWFLVPESPRWLLAKGKVEEAKMIVTKGAAINKTTIPSDLFEVQVKFFGLTKIFGAGRVQLKIVCDPLRELCLDQQKSSERVVYNQRLCAVKFFGANKNPRNGS